MKNKQLGIVIGLVILVALVLFYRRDNLAIPPSAEKEGSANSDTTLNQEDAKIAVLAGSPTTTVPRTANEVASNQAISNDQLRNLGTSAKQTNVLPPMTNEEYFQKYLRDPERVTEEREFNQSDSRFRTLPGILAYKTKELPPNLATSVLRDFLSFTLVKDQPAERTPGKTYPVVYDLKRGTLAIVTGSIKVLFESELQSSAIASRFNLQLVQEFSDIKVASFRSSAPRVDDLILIAEAIRKEPGIKTASLVLIDSVRTPN